MGPRSFNRGNLVAIIEYERNYNASMGPRSFNRGNFMEFVGGGRSWLASMGPRSFNRGNAVAGERVSLAQHGFNGAAVFQPRKWASVRWVLA